jgi:hypothetical protein
MVRVDNGFYACDPTTDHTVNQGVCIVSMQDIDLLSTGNPSDTAKGQIVGLPLILEHEDGNAGESEFISKRAAFAQAEYGRFKHFVVHDVAERCDYAFETTDSQVLGNVHDTYAAGGGRGPVQAFGRTTLNGSGEYGH